MFLDMNLINHRLSLKIAFFSTVIFAFFLFLLLYIFSNELRYRFFFYSPFIFMFLFFIVYYICKIYLYPLDKMEKEFNNLNKTNYYEKIKLNDNDWLKIESNLNDLIIRLNSLEFSLIKHNFNLVVKDEYSPVFTNAGVSIGLCVSMS